MAIIVETFELFVDVVMSRPPSVYALRRPVGEHDFSTFAITRSLRSSRCSIRQTHGYENHALIFIRQEPAGHAP